MRLRLFSSEDVFVLDDLAGQNEDNECCIKTVPFIQLLHLLSVIIQTPLDLSITMIKLHK